MNRLQLWCARTIRNWRWWAILPLLPIVLIGSLAQVFGEWANSAFTQVFKWQKRGWKA